MVIRHTILLIFAISVILQHGFCIEKFRPCRKVVIEEGVALNISSMIVNTIPLMKIMDGYPFLFKNPKSNVSSLVCLAEKVASSTWKSFFIKVKSKVCNE